MTTGAILFAQNNPEIDYIKLAAFAAKRVKEHLGIPVSIITDSRSWLLESQPDHVFDKIIDIENVETTQKKKFNDGSLSFKFLNWKNLSRSQVYDLSPYDRTLVLDSDYIINSDILKSAIDNDYDFQIYKKSKDLAVGRDVSGYERINSYSIPFYWATVFVFQKNEIMQAFFDLITYIKLNWEYFKILYGIDNSLFRNDYAFSIAIHIMNGKTNGEFATALPGTMTYISDSDILIKTSGDSMQFLVEKHNYIGEYLIAKTSGIDIHVMNKLSLSRYIDGGSGV